MTPKHALFIGLPVAVALAVNVGIARKRLLSTANPWIPPGPIVGAIWVLLLASLGHAAFCAQNARTSAAIIAYIAFCIAYPFAARSDRIARTLNALALIFASVIVVLTRSDKFVLPVAAWTAYVNVVDNFA